MELPFLTIKETAELARVSAKRIRNLMSDGTLREGEHFVRPKGIATRFKRAAVLAWLEGSTEAAEESIPMASTQRRRLVAIGRGV